MYIIESEAEQEYQQLKLNDNIPKMVQDFNPQIQRAQKIAWRLNTNKSTAQIGN